MAALRTLESQCDSILDHMGRLHDVLSDDESGLVSETRETARRAVELGEWIRAQLAAQPKSPLHDVINDRYKSMRDFVVQFVKQKRVVYQNPMDYLSKQKLQNLKKEVTDSMAQLLSVSKSLLEEKGSDSLVSSDERDLFTPRECDEIIAITNTCREQLVLLRKVVNKDIVADFRETVKSIVDAFKGFSRLLAGRNNQCERELATVKELILLTVRDANVLVANPLEHSYRIKFDASFTPSVNGLRNLIVFVSSHSRSLSRHLSSRSSMQTSLDLSDIPASSKRDSSHAERPVFNLNMFATPQVPGAQETFSLEASEEALVGNEIVLELSTSEDESQTSFSLSTSRGNSSHGMVESGGSNANGGAESDGDESDLEEVPVDAEIADAPGAGDSPSPSPSPSPIKSTEISPRLTVSAAPSTSTRSVSVSQHGRRPAAVAAHTRTNSEGGTASTPMIAGETGVSGTDAGSNIATDGSDTSDASPSLRRSKNTSLSINQLDTKSSLSSGKNPKGRTPRSPPEASPRTKTKSGRSKRMKRSTSKKSEPTPYSIPVLDIRVKEKSAMKIITSLQEKIPKFKDLYNSRSDLEKVLVRKSIIAELSEFESLVHKQAAAKSVRPKEGDLKTTRESREKEKTAIPSDTPKEKKLGVRTRPRSTSRNSNDRSPSGTMEDDELRKLMAVTSATDLNSMTVGKKRDTKFGTLAKRFGRKKQNDFKLMSETSMQAGFSVMKEAAVEVLVAAQSLFTFFDTVLSEGTSKKDKDKDRPVFSLSRDKLTSAVEAFYTQLLNGIGSILGNVSAKDVYFIEALNRANDQLTTARHTGEIVPLHDKLTSTPFHLRLVEVSLLTDFHHNTKQCFFACSQILTDVAEFATQKTPQSLLHYLALVDSLTTIIGVLLDEAETLNYLEDFSMNFDEKTSSNKSKKQKKASSSSSIWDELKELPEDPEAERDAPGTLAHLIARLTPESGQELDHEFSKAFLVTWPAFCEPSEIVKLCLERFDCPKKLKKEEAAVIKSRVISFLRKWINHSPEYIDSTLADSITHFAEKLKKDKNYEVLGKSILSLLEKASQWEVSATLSRESTLDIPVFTGDPPFEAILHFDETVIAQQLTLIEAELYGRIKSAELLGQAWNKEKQAAVSKNVSGLLTRANRVSFWVSTLILLQPKLKDRIKVLTKFMAVAKILRNLNNYNTLMGVVAGLNTSSISRLKHTFNGVKDKMLQQWEDIVEMMHPSNSFKTLRSTQEQSGHNCIPYLGMYLSDLTFMEDGNPDVVERDGKEVINFPKHYMIHKTIDRLLRYQGSLDYSYINRAEPIFTFVYELASLNENELYHLSLAREPRGAILKDID
eukprot:TRINITY_DN3523_c0_g1_i1.p1 TRINITY_DN3523_c0_g1~~TRINITY_DN3523_c0_g1_i1.p1  ORF type:complete len:1339 (+),score=367.76 TRINITY_DN3523_c0_g1_i1:157-4173(+)